MQIGNAETSERSPAQSRRHNGFRSLALALLTTGAAFLGLKAAGQNTPDNTHANSVMSPGSSSPDTSHQVLLSTEPNQDGITVKPEIQRKQEEALDQKELEQEAKELLDGYEQAIKDQKIPQFLSANAEHPLLPLLAAGPEGLAIIEHPGPIEDDGENMDLHVYKPGEIINEKTDDGLTGFDIGGNWAVTRVGGKIGYYDTTQTIKAEQPKP